MNQMIELHDSKIAVIWFDNEAARLIFSHAYIHQSEGEPGLDKGTGWSQRAELVLGEATKIDVPSSWPLTIYDGSIELSGVVHDNQIPIPLMHDGSVKLKLDVADCDDQLTSLEFIGRGAHLALLGEARYIEEFRVRAE